MQSNEAIKKVQNGKAPGLDNINPEMLKLQPLHDVNITNTSGRSCTREYLNNGKMGSLKRF